ncbi:MAG: tryptophan synthase subunit alpha [Chthoniobacterales bacterium]|nr:tryptophan synthase subunit alpha [Chthoniobacterales bacterium]
MSESFSAASAARRGGFIPFLVAGDPDLKTTAALLPALSELAPVAIEVGVPFSDPTADGPVIQRAAQRALANGTSLNDILALLRRSSPNELAPLVLFSYYNPIFQLGVGEFARAAAACGVAGVLVVDLPAEAAGPLHTQLLRRKIDLIFLATPTTTDERLKRIARMASGFVYAVARTGVTGTARELKDESQNLVARIRSVTDLPVAVGFGITTGAQAKRVCGYADAAVVGSRLVAEIEEASGAGGAAKSRADVVRAAIECARQFA